MKRVLGIFLSLVLGLVLVTPCSMAKEGGDSLSELVGGLPKEGYITKKRVQIHVLNAHQIDYYSDGKLVQEYKNRENQNITFARNGKIKLVIYGENTKYTRKFIVDRMAPNIWRSGKYIRWSDSISGIKKVTINGKTVKGKKYKMKKYNLHNNGFSVVAYDKAGNEKHKYIQFDNV